MLIYNRIQFLPSEVKDKIEAEKRVWLITGVAGFIGSNLLEVLLSLGQRVVGLDDFSTGFGKNLEEVKASVSRAQWEEFQLIEGDIRNFEICEKACRGVDYVLHQAALGSVPRSLKDPITTSSVNINGFLNMLRAMQEGGAKRFVYAASSSTYGDHPALPKREDVIGRPLSPYAVTKYVNELYADVFARCYEVESIGLRYFNVFGPRQDPNGAYAAVIPRWLHALLKNQDVQINGDGETSRDFCYVDNVIQANLLAATEKSKEAVNQVYNVALGQRTSLNELFLLLKKKLKSKGIESESKPVHRDFRTGDVRHSQADITKAMRLIKYSPTHPIDRGIEEALSWYIENLVDQ